MLCSYSRCGTELCYAPAVYVVLTSVMLLLGVSDPPRSARIRSRSTVPLSSYPDAQTPHPYPPTTSPVPL
eukprot:2170896-Rhodomonas_salina.1